MINNIAADNSLHLVFTYMLFQILRSLIKKQTLQAAL